MTKDVFAQVEDVADQPAQFFGLGVGGEPADEAGVEIPDALGDELEKALEDGEESDPGKADEDDDSEKEE